MDMIIALLAALNTLSPLGLAGLLGLVLWNQSRNRKAVAEVSENHLSGMPDILDAVRRMEGLLLNINNNVIYLRARINGGPSV